MNTTKFWKAIGIFASFTLAVGIITLTAIGWSRLLMETGLPAPPPSAARPQPHVPVVTVNKPADPNNHAYSFAACARGGTGSCIQVGAWMIEQAKMGRTLEMCVKASDTQGDQPVPVVEHCTGIEARWPN